MQIVSLIDQFPLYIIFQVRHPQSMVRIYIGGLTFAIKYVSSHLLHDLVALSAIGFHSKLHDIILYDVITNARAQKKEEKENKMKCTLLSVEIIHIID